MPLRSKLDIRISHLLLIKTSLSPNLLKLFLLCVTLSSNHHIEVCCKDTNVTLCTVHTLENVDNLESIPPTNEFWLFSLVELFTKKKTGRADEITLASRRMQNLPLECMRVLFHCVLFFFSHPFSQTDGALIFRHFSPSLGCFGVMERRVTRYLFRFA